MKLTSSPLWSYCKPVGQILLKKSDIINLPAGTTEEVDTRVLLHAKHAAEY